VLMDKHKRGYQSLVRNLLKGSRPSSLVEQPM